MGGHLSRCFWLLFLATFHKAGMNGSRLIDLEVFSQAAILET